jgi:hypothetical protein
MKTRLAAFALLSCLSLIAFARPKATAPANPTDDDFRKLEQAWLDAASGPDLPALRKMLSDEFMGTSFGVGVLTKSDVVPDDGTTANHMPKCVLKDSTVKMFGDTAILMGTVVMGDAAMGDAAKPGASSKPADSAKPEDVRMTTVFQKHPEGWQVIAIHMSKAQE